MYRWESFLSNTDICGLKSQNNLVHQVLLDRKCIFGNYMQNFTDKYDINQNGNQLKKVDLRIILRSIVMKLRGGKKTQRC